jgi:hypothetical protein
VGSRGRFRGRVRISEISVACPYAGTAASTPCHRFDVPISSRPQAFR